MARRRHAAYYLTSNVYVAAFASSVVLSTLAFWLGVTRAASGWQAAVVAIILFFSRAFVDFSTSGLENPLSYVLLAVFVGIFLSVEESPERRSPRRALTLLWLTASLLYLTRPDDVLLVAPLLVLATWRLRREAGIVKPVVIGVLPAIAWTLFAIVYYGFPFPNTAYAKLAMGIDRSELWTQGFLYLIDSVDRDPLTLTTIAFAVLLAVVQKRAAARALAAGLILYLLYVASIGGDFMAGRFLAVPLYGAALLTGTLARGPRPMWIAAGVVFIAIGSAGSHLPLWSNSKFNDSGNKPSGIIDERGVYFRDKSLVLAKRATFLGSVAALNELAIRRPDGTPAEDPSVRALTQPLAVLCGDRPGVSHVDIAVDSNDQSRVGLTARAKSRPGSLSGGHQQLVAIARAIAGRPPIVLADEPTGNLDSTSGEAVMKMLEELHAGGSTICIATHDPRYIARTTRRIYLFDGRVVPEPVA